MNILISLTNILLSFSLAMFACLQWKAVEKQNRQNLFSLRIEFYNEINNIIWKILFAFMDLKEGIHKTKNETTSKIALLSLELSHNKLKMKYLFNEDIFNKLDTFIKTSISYNALVQDTKNFADLNFAEVFEKSDEFQAIMEEFFHKNYK